MFFHSLSLKDFRNIKFAELEFGQGLNIFIGKNAQGKTNIVEAINLFSTGRSFRTSDYRDMIKKGSTTALVNTAVEISEGKDNYTVILDTSKKTFSKNQKNTSPASLKKVVVVLFAPEEILVLKDYPSARRTYLDAAISKLKAGYAKIVRDYEVVVRHRNKILQTLDLNGPQKLKQLEPWNTQLIDLGSRIIVERTIWCDRINEILPKKYGAFAGCDGAAAFNYRPRSRDLTETIVSRSNDELVRMTTLVGPHRDDIEATIDGYALKGFGSQGQYRSFVLSLKMTEMALIESFLGELAVLVLDDVASELDSDRNRNFFEYLAVTKGQVFITTTDEEFIKIGSSPTKQRFFVSEGNVTGDASHIIF